jgi:hypothetical protein
VALVCEGRVSGTALSRIPRLRDHLRWVKAGSLRASSRVASALGAGAGVDTYDFLEKTRVVVLAVPGDRIPGVVRELKDALPDWSEKSVVSYDLHLGAHLEALKSLGASTASLAPVGGPDRSSFIVEGDARAVRDVQPLFGRGERLIIVEPGGVPRFFEGVEIAHTIFLRNLETAIEKFEQAGLPRARAADVASRLMEGTLRAYERAGRRLVVPTGDFVAENSFTDSAAVSPGAA